MNPWDEIAPHVADDLSAMAGFAQEVGSELTPTVCIPSACAAFLGLPARGVAVSLICGATVDTQVTAARDGDGWVLAGSAGAVPWGDEATTLLIAASVEPSPSSGPLGLFVVETQQPGVTRTPRASIGTRGMCTVGFERVRVGPEARFDDGARATWPSVVDALDKATIVAAAELAGITRRALDRAIAYATAREQFGAPIATYQALAHRLADMAIDADAAELAVEEAVAEPTTENASRAKIIANDAAHRVTAGLHQINGGVGFYADQPPPGFYARALALRVEMGDSSVHRLRLARSLAYPARRPMN